MATTERTFTTAGGRLARMSCRDGTNDAMVAEACIEQDEYQTADIDAGYVLDIGGHIGSWSVGYLLDHPDSGAVIVEPIPENARAIATNLALNNLASRALIVVGALASDVGDVEIRWNFSGDASAEMHRYIGGQRMAVDTRSDTLTTTGYDIRALLGLIDAESAGLVKIDCEGGESALVGQDLSGLGYIVGEYHVPRDPLWLWLARTHDVVMMGDDTFGSFRAVPL